ncbi:dienelactone hydrolase family protein [Ensifer sp. NBAIM29]|nr:dienelactone hydrolase family protein [Ensifer sp. NBAIM29]
MAPERTDVIEVEIPPHRLPGFLRLPESPRGVIVFAHGSGSSRQSPRNTYVAEALRRRGFATLLFDLLSGWEAENRANVFDIRLLADRLGDACSWVATAPGTRGLAIGLFGASTGAAAALVAAAELGDRVFAVVSRGGRPDLAAAVLEGVGTPTLLVVGGDDEDVLRLNRAALAKIAGPKRLEIIPGATHLFSEPGALDAVIEAAADWFESHCGRNGRTESGG